MHFFPSRKVKFHFSKNLTYDWVGTIQRAQRLYKVHRSKEVINSHDGKKTPSIVFRLTSDNRNDDYIIVEKENPRSRFWYTVSDDMLLKIIENEFLPKDYKAAGLNHTKITINKMY